MTWRERLVDARSRGFFTQDEINAAESSWLSCPVGEQHTYLPQVVVYTDFNMPLDRVLWALGNSLDGERGFGWAVKHQDITLAEKRLDEIEDRILQLKRKTGNA